MQAQDQTTDGPLALEGSYKGDVVSYDGGDGRRGTAALDLLSIVAHADLGRVSPGLSAQFHVENTSGDAPNSVLETARGFDNSEVDRQRLRLFEAWVEQGFGDGAGSVRLGYFDFNSEFNATASSGLFLGPGFGISTEISGAVFGGPSIFPSSGLGVRGRVRLGEGGYFQAAVINAHVGVPGDLGGPQWRFDRGVLLATESGVESGGTRMAVGAWRYSQPAQDVPAGHRHPEGAYVLLERRLGGEDAPATAFLRAGISNGKVEDFSSAAQVGVSVSPVFHTRPDSALGVGLDYVGFSSAYRDGLLADNTRSSRGETGLEITYADRLLGPVLVQPDLQVIFHPQGDQRRPTAQVATVRFTVEF